MLNPELLRRDPERTRTILARRDEDAARAFDAAVEADTRWRELTADVEHLRAERRRRSESFRGKPSDEDREALRELGQQLSNRETELSQVESERNTALAWLPNLPDASVPLGKDDSENEVLRAWGEPKKLDFEPK